MCIENIWKNTHKIGAIAPLGMGLEDWEKNILFFFLYCLCLELLQNKLLSQDNIKMCNTTNIIVL